jgi:hypothetical protein
MKNLQLNSVRVSSAKIIIPDKKDYLKEKAAWNFPKWGEDRPTKKKGAKLLSPNPSILLEPMSRIELLTC